MKKSRLAATMALAAIVLLMSWILIRPDYPMRAGSDRPLSGYVTSGEKFGIKIGASQADARKALDLQGSNYIDQEDCKSISSIIRCEPQSRNDAYDINKLIYHGKIYILLDADYKVNAIAWDFHILPYVDF